MDENRANGASHRAHGDHVLVYMMMCMAPAFIKLYWFMDKGRIRKSSAVYNFEFYNMR